MHRIRSRRPWAVRAVLIALCALALAAPAADVAAREAAAQRQAVTLGELPLEAREILDRIRTGGAFRFERDGVVFGNREHSLPSRKRGYYHEYTVVTPGVRTRGARRIVCGGPRTAPDMCYYSDDHYATFRRIRE